MKKEVIVAKDAPKAIGPYSAGMRAGDFLFTAGQLGIWEGHFGSRRQRAGERDQDDRLSARYERLRRHERRLR